jgi:hypothetical protein
MTEDAEIKAVIPSYYGFLITGITQLREYWARKMYTEALDYALELTNFLPTKIKEQLKEDKEKIITKLGTNSPINANTLYRVEMARSKQAYHIAARELEPFVDKIIRLLDQNHLLTEKYGVPTRARGMKDFQMTVDEAQFRKDKEGT